MSFFNHRWAWHQGDPVVSGSPVAIAAGHSIRVCLEVCCRQELVSVDVGWLCYKLVGFWMFLDVFGVGWFDVLDVFGWLVQFLLGRLITRSWVAWLLAWFVGGTVCWVVVQWVLHNGLGFNRWAQQFGGWFAKVVEKQLDMWRTQVSCSTSFVSGVDNLDSPHYYVSWESE